ncbi:MAG: hypothetical protein EU541_05150 [Promethearchaeota archaeon]|nr:MAG: hypothetical protein EU541_05150 [Candidatus Lokiarchaeota archaeon]
MIAKEEIKKSDSKFEDILLNPYVIICLIGIFIGAFFFQLLLPGLDESFISEVLRFELLRPICDPFWLVLYWPTVAIFFLSITVYFVFANKRGLSLAMLAIVVIGGLFLGDALKSFFSLFGLGRPAQELSSWVPAIYGDFLPTTSETSDFPGQSILVPAAFSVYFYLRNPKKWKAIVFPIYVGLMVFARPYVGVNHISANIGGLIIGIYMGLIVYKYGESIRKSVIFDNRIKKTIVAIGVFGLMFLIYWIQRPVFVSRAAQGVDLDIRMFMMVFGGFLGLALLDYPREINFQLDTTQTKGKYFLSIFLSYLVLFGLYFGSLALPDALLWIGIIIGFLDGLWIAYGGPRLVEYLNQETIK